ncbi:MAG: hypothetical protein R3288_06420 [Woeseiaceae bacterium]|nr:hypothetical protein [Woeseiaceae bacterium]
MYDDDAPLSFGSLFEQLRGDAAFADWFSTLLAGFDAPAFYWELPALTTADLAGHAEFVLIEGRMLARMAPEPQVFAAYFSRQPDQDVAVFANLGGDATLIAPCPRSADPVYAHLASFLRGAAAEQIRSLWRVSAEALLHELGDAPRWLSTAGGGVAWLHVRIDRRPKYYRHDPYRTSSG